MPQVVQSLKYVHGNSPVLHVLAHQVADVFAQATLALDVHSRRPPRSAQPGCVVLTLSQLKVPLSVPLHIATLRYSLRLSGTDKISCNLRWCRDCGRLLSTRIGHPPWIRSTSPEPASGTGVAHSDPCSDALNGEQHGESQHARPTEPCRSP
jgi:hypothetical protein